MSNSVKIGRGRVVPLTFRVVGTVFIMLLFFVLFENTSEIMAVGLGIPFSMTLPLLWTSRYITEINPERKVVFEYIWMMGFKVGRPQPYVQLEKIFVNTVGMAQRMTSYGGSVHTSRFLEYKAYLKYDQNKLEIFDGRDREKTLESMQKISKKLNIPFQDNTEVES